MLNQYIGPKSPLMFRNRKPCRRNPDMCGCYSCRFPCSGLRRGSRSPEAKLAARAKAEAIVQEVDNFPPEEKNEPPGYGTNKNRDMETTRICKYGSKLNHQDTDRRCYRVTPSWSLHCYLNFCYEIFLLVTRSSQNNTRFNRKCSRHPRKCNLLPFEFALVCAFLRRFALVLHFFCTFLRAFWRQLDHGEEENTAEWDFCPNRQKALGSEWEAKSATSSQFWYRTRGEAENYATMEVPGCFHFPGVPFWVPISEPHPNHVSGKFKWKKPGLQASQKGSKRHVIN